jgi:hypothetical protein
MFRRLSGFLGGSEQRLAFDGLVLATVNRSEGELADGLRGLGKEFRAIGDCLSPRHAPAAIYEGRRLGLEI